MAKKRGRPKFQGCNEDCFHCPYPDCKKPARLMEKDNSVVKAIRVNGSYEKMYTVTLGGPSGPSGVRYGFRHKL